MLEMKPKCERCGNQLGWPSPAYICSYECTFCPACTKEMGGKCRNCNGELVSRPADVGPALERAFAAGKPALVNVLTDPTVIYPRRSNLA